jgi:dolichyl-phosphate beta-glucosyltransferase
MRDLSQLKLIRHPINQGKGAAVRSGIQAATGDFFLFLDADLATHPSEFEKFLPVLQQADIVIGSRTARGSVIARQQPVYRVLLGKIFNRLVVRWYLGLPFFDTQCGFKVFQRKAKPLFDDLTSRGWAFDVELLLRARQAGLRIAEVPVEWRHGRESRVRLRDVFQILGELKGMKREPTSAVQIQANH